MGVCARIVAGCAAATIALACGGRPAPVDGSPLAADAEDCGAGAGAGSSGGNGSTGHEGEADAGAAATAPPTVPDGGPVEADAGDACAGGCDAEHLPAPRLVAPLSTATTTSQRPTLHWVLPAGADGARVDVCRDRACTTSVTTFDAHGSSGAPPVALAEGVYFWRARATLAGRAGIDASATWELWTGARTAPVDTSWGTIPDFDGDGRPELVVGAFDTDGGVGAAFVYPGGPSGPFSTPIVFTGPSTRPVYYGTSVASAGDVDGDGFADLIVGAPGNAGYGLAGNAFVYLGGPEGLSHDPASLTGPSQASSVFGDSVASAGDVNGDGYADVVVGASGALGAYVFYGGPHGIVTTPAATLRDETTPPTASVTVASAGDVNGDGYSDLIVGYYGLGVAFVHAGGTGWTSRTPLELVGPENGFGHSVASAGDLNGDGLADVVVGDVGKSGPHGNTVGTVAVYLGSAKDLLAPTPNLLGRASPTLSMMGWSVAGAGDVNGDGRDDLIVGAFSDSARGTLYLYLGTADGVGPVPIEFLGDDTMMGRTVARAGDVNHDGFADVITGVPGVYPSGGTASLYLGTVSGLATKPALVLEGPPGPGQFGSSVE